MYYTLNIKRYFLYHRSLYKISDLKQVISSQYIYLLRLTAKGLLVNLRFSEIFVKALNIQLFSAGFDKTYLL